MTNPTTTSRFLDSNDDDSSTGSLLVSPTKTIDWGEESAEATAAIQAKTNFKNSNGGGDDDARSGTDNTRTAMDVTFQDSIDIPHRKEQQEQGGDDESLLFETDASNNEDAVTPAKHRFSYAAAMEQLDSSWLAPTPKRPNNNRDDSLDLTMEEKEEEDGGTCLEEQFSESPIQDEDDFIEEMPEDDSIVMIKNDEEDYTNVQPSSPEATTAPLAPAPKYSPASAAATAALLNNQEVLSPNSDTSVDEADTTSAIFRHPSIHHNQEHQQQITTSSNMMMTLQHGHPVNESYDSVEQRKLHLEQETNCISSFLADRDRVENDIVMTKNRVDGGDGSMMNVGDGVVGGEEKNDEMDTLNEEQVEEENDDALNETELSIYGEDEEEEEEERVFKISVLDTLKEHVDEAKMTLTQTADGTSDSDVFLKKIEHAENDEGYDVVVRSYEDKANGNDVLDEESNVAEKEEECDESVGESRLTNSLEVVDVDKDVSLSDGDNAVDQDEQSEGNDEDINESSPAFNLTYPEPITEGVAKDDEENDNDANVTANEYHLSSPTVPPAEGNGMQGSISPVVESSEIGGDSNLKGEDIIGDKPDFASSRGDSLAFSTSADTDDTLELSQQAQNTSQSNETGDGNIENANLCPNHDCSTSTAPGVNVGNHYLEYGASNQSPLEVEAGADLSFDGNCLSASLDVSLSNIDREALFAGSFSQQLSPIRQNSSSPHDLSQRHDDDLNGDEIQLPAALDTSSVSGSLSPRDRKPPAGAEGLDKCSVDPVANERDVFAVAAEGSLEGSPATSSTADNAEINKGSIFAVLSQVNTGASTNNVVVQDELPMNEKASDNEEKGPSGEANTEDNFTYDASLEKTSDKHLGNPVDDELDERNKSLEDLSSYQQSFNSTSSAFLERLRVAAESRKREVTKARFSMERKEQILYERREDRDVMPTLSEMADEKVDEPIRASVTKTPLVKPFKARPLPSADTFSEPTSHHQTGCPHPRSTSTIGSKRKSTSALRPHMHDNKPYGINSISAKPPKRLLSGEDASNAKEMTRRRLLQEEDERARRESVFRARPLPASTLPGAGLLEQPTRLSHNSKAARTGKENSAFMPSSTARAEARAAYNSRKKVNEEERRQEQIRKRNALIHKTNEEIEKMKRFLR